jgi:hypothetical protein
MKDSQSFVEESISDLFLAVSYANRLTGDSIRPLDDMRLEEIKEQLVNILNNYIDDNA